MIWINLKTVSRMRTKPTTSPEAQRDSIKMLSTWPRWKSVIPVCMEAMGKSCWWSDMSPPREGDEGGGIWQTRERGGGWSCRQEEVWWRLRRQRGPEWKRRKRSWPITPVNRDLRKTRELTQMVRAGKSTHIRHSSRSTWVKVFCKSIDSTSSFKWRWEKKKSGL